MKKKIIIIGVIIICVCSIWGFFQRRKPTISNPYEKLDDSEIISATVHLIPPDKTIQITDIEELVTYLKDVVVFKKDNSYKYRMHFGQVVTFILTLRDGSQEEISAFYPFIIINGTGYKAEYGPCENLNSYANRLLNKSE